MSWMKETYNSLDCDGKESFTAHKTNEINIIVSFVLNWALKKSSSAIRTDFHIKIINADQAYYNSSSL